MLSPRRHLYISLASWSLLLSSACVALGIGIWTYTENFLLSLGISALLWTLAELSLLWLKIHLPLKKITQEMKALLTGKSYRRIMTSKRNEIGILAHFFNEITRNLESLGSDVKEHKRLKKELNTAQRIQRDLLPSQAPQIPGLDIVAKTRPATEIGGDTFNFYSKKDRSFIYIGDSTGHGIPAGIVMIMVDTLLSTFIHMLQSPKDMMVHLNNYLKPHLQTTMFMTMILLEWDHKSILKWVGAGHEHIIHIKAADKSIQTTPAGGIAVGMMPDNSQMTKEQKLTLNKNDCVILYSDGIVEAKNVVGEIYSLKRLEEIAKTYYQTTTSAQELFTRIALDVSRFMEGRAQEDDMTLIVIKQSETSSQSSSTQWDLNEESVAEGKAPSNEALS